MPRVGPRCVVLLLALSASSARAGTEWLCALSDSATQIVCVAEPATQANETVSGVQAVVNGVAFPLNRGRRYTVEMWSPPTDLAFAAQLAQATMCYRTPDCRVSWAEPVRAALR